MCETRAFLKLERRLSRALTPEYAAHWAEVHAAARGDDPPSARKPKVPAWGFGPSRTRAYIVAGAAAGLAREGKEVTPRALAEASKVPLKSVYRIIDTLAARGEWPHPRRAGAGAIE